VDEVRGNYIHAFALSGFVRGAKDPTGHQNSTMLPTLPLRHSPLTFPRTRHSCKLDKESVPWQADATRKAMHGRPPRPQGIPHEALARGCDGETSHTRKGYRMGNLLEAFFTWVQGGVLWSCKSHLDVKPPVGDAKENQRMVMQCMAPHLSPWPRVSRCHWTSPAGSGVHVHGPHPFAPGR